MQKITPLPMTEQLAVLIRKLEFKLVAKCDEILEVARTNNLTDTGRENRISITHRDITYVLSKPRAYVDREYRIEIIPADSEKLAGVLFEYRTGLVWETSFSAVRRRRNAPSAFAPYDHYMTMSSWRMLQVMAFDVVTKMHKYLRELIKEASVVNKDFAKRFNAAITSIEKGQKHDDRKGTHRKAPKV